MVFMCYGPLLFDFAQADCQAKIQAFLLTIGSRFSAMHRGDDESDIAAGSDAHFSNIEGHWIAGPGKEQVPRVLVGLNSPGLKRRRNVEHDYARRIDLEDPPELYRT